MAASDSIARALRTRANAAVGSLVRRHRFAGRGAAVADRDRRAISCFPDRMAFGGASPDHGAVRALARSHPRLRRHRDAWATRRSSARRLHSGACCQPARLWRADQRTVRRRRGRGAAGGFLSGLVLLRYRGLDAAGAHACRPPSCCRKSATCSRIYRRLRRHARHHHIAAVRRVRLRPLRPHQLSLLRRGAVRSCSTWCGASSIRRSVEALTGIRENVGACMRSARRCTGGW